MSPFEIGMLVCFGFSWPISVHTTWKAKRPTGKSMPFLWMVFLGYACGIVHKLFFHLDAVIWFYILNASLVLVDIMLCNYYTRHPGTPAGPPVDEVAAE